ncbi:hypothetical protein ACFW1K_40255, partial [Streptomyces tendae]
MRHGAPRTSDAGAQRDSGGGKRTVLDVIGQFWTAPDSGRWAQRTDDGDGAVRHRGAGRTGTAGHCGGAEGDAGAARRQASEGAGAAGAAGAA